MSEERDAAQQGLLEVLEADAEGALDGLVLLEELRLAGVLQEGLDHRAGCVGRRADGGEVRVPLGQVGRPDAGDGPLEQVVLLLVLLDEVGDLMRDTGREFGSTTGRPRRCGWLDLVALKYAIMINGVTQLSMMKVDVLDKFEEIKACTHYKLQNGTLTDHYDPVTRTGRATAASNV